MNREVRLLFHELVELSPGERERALRERRVGAELRAEVESLLSFDTTEVLGLTARVSNVATEVLRAVGRPDGRASFDAPVKRLKPRSADVALHGLADYKIRSGNVRRTAELYEELLERVLAAKPQPETSLADALALSNLYRASASFYRRAGHSDRAHTLEARRLDLWQRWNRKFPDRSFIRRQLDAAQSPRNIS